MNEDSNPSDTDSRTERRRRRLASIVEEALHISDSYRPEPILATTGQGSLKSKGVAGLLEDEAYLRQRALKKRTHAEAPR